MQTEIARSIVNALDVEEAIDFGWNVATITEVDPLLESLRDDPRFQSALDRMEADLAPIRDRVQREGL